jgi:hypothetical protein
MCTREPLLWQLLSLVDAIPEPPPPSKRRRGCPVTYPDTLFLKILLLMVLRRFFKVHEVYAFLSQQSAEIDGLRALLFADGKVPSRRTLERRMKSLPESLSERIALLGEHLVELYQPWQRSARAVAIDSTVLRARGAPWHMKDRRAGRVPNTSIDTDAHWTHSSWHGWTYGYKLHLAVSMSTVWIPLAAEFKPANEADNTVAEELIFSVLPYVKFFCGDSAYNCPNVHEAAENRGATVVASSRAKGPRTDPGVEVRKIIHALRHHTIENFNGLYKNIFDARRPLPTKGLVNGKRFALGCVFTYQVILLLRHKRGELGQTNIKALLRSA